ncbi:MAG: RIO1 family regulatory kinase/ATPase domain-containing protein [Candidatus Njordarchaeales archaeon]
MDLIIAEGRHSVVLSIPHIGIAFKIFRKGYVRNADKEYSFLKILEHHDFPVPKPYNLLIINDYPILVREYIPGQHFNEFLDDSPPEKIVKVLKRVIELSFKLDEIGIFLDELSNPTKNIIVNSRGVFFIDFERAQELRGNKSNVTQFLSFLIRVGKSSSQLKKKLERFVNFDKLVELSKEFKQSKDLEKVLSEAFIGQPAHASSLPQ